MNDTLEFKTPPQPMISADRISKSFDEAGTALQVLQDISVTIGKGEFVCFLGPSGCGKSTLLRIMSGLAKPDGGEVDMDPDTKTALIFQNFAIFPWLNVIDNVGFGLKMAGVHPQKIHHQVAAYIAEMGLVGFEHQHPRELSGGMKQRVGIARALSMEPDILFMDEPFSALDTFTARRLRADLLEVWQKKRMTVIMVTHLVEEAVQMADRVVVFSPRPGRVEGIVDIHLPRPRKLRDDKFFALVDQLEKLVAG